MSAPRLGFPVLLAALAVIAVLVSSRPSPAGPQQGEGERLRSPAELAGIADRRERSIALFTEAGKVLLHPRCVNCHPADEMPRQGDVPVVHDPPVFRGGGLGLPAMRCTSCHQDRNLDYARVPGAPGWHLAPREMAWLGRSLGQICNQLKDPERNGGKTLAEIQHHMAHDELVGWGWNPGADRTPAPGTQAELGALIQAWIRTGAACPPEEAAR